jgi:hypothetical protein
MHALKMAATFAAFTWYSRKEAAKSQQEAARLARANWTEFLPVANEGLGKLLLRIASPVSARGTSTELTRNPRPASVC